MKTAILFVLLTTAFCSFSQDAGIYFSGQQLWDRVSRRYDPTGIWDQYRGEMHLYTLRPEGGSSEEDLVLDNSRSFYQSTRFLNGTIVMRGLNQGEPFFSVNGRLECSDQERKDYRLTKEDAHFFFQHHALHFGLPMYLKKAGVAVEEKVKKEPFNGRDCLVLAFSGTPGKTVHPYFDSPLYLYIDPENYAMAGIRFPEGGLGFPPAYAVFSDEIEVGGIRIPQVRTYYREAGGSYWFTDSFHPFTRMLYQGREAEEAAIREALDKETKYYYVRDYDKWAECWSHREDVFSSWSSKNGYNIVKGWDELSRSIKTFMQQNPDPHMPPIERSNFVFHLEGNLAWVYFDNREGEQSGRHQRVLRKEDGRWKLINMTSVAESSYAAAASEGN